MTRCLLAAFFWLTIAPAASAQIRAPLPPALPWSGPSEALIAEADDPWITPAERDDFRLTPDYAETRSWLERLVRESGLLSMESFGTSAEGRDLYFVRAGKGGADRPVVLVQAGIHAHEIDGKDAGLMLLRDIALRGKAGLLDRVDLVFVPIFNVDGHERRSPYNAPHLRGPENPGTRDTAQNVNLNRDYAKAAAPETRAMLGLLRRLDPVLYVDMHVSDGFDHGYDVTYTFAGWGRHARSEAITAWLDGPFESGVDRFLREMGHNPHFYPSAIDADDIQRGLRVAAEGPRYSTGYGDHARIPTVLVEIHHLKPYRQRVLGAYAMIEGALRTVAAEIEPLRAAIAADRAARPRTLPVRWERDDAPFETVPFTGVAYEKVPSEASGTDEVRYLGRTEQWQLPVTGQHVVETVTLPAAWWVPASETAVIALLDLHGIAYERTDAPTERTLDVVRMRNVELGPVYDAEIRMSGEAVHGAERVVLPEGSVRVPYDQDRGLLAAALLEPESVDSLFSWGVFPELARDRSAMERFIAAPLAERMLAENPEARRAFEARLARDRAFAADPEARLQWFVDRAHYGDDDASRYPIARERRDD